MNRLQERIVWGLAALLIGASWARIAMLPDPYAAGARSPIEDRRQYRFRDLDWSQTQRLFESLVQAAERAPDDLTRARYLARVAALQHERGMDEAAQAAAREALRFAPNDAETRRLIASPLDLKTLN